MPYSTYRQVKLRNMRKPILACLSAFLARLKPKFASAVIYGALYDKKQHILIGERITPLMIKQAGSFAKLRTGYLFVSGKPALQRYAEAHGYKRVLFTS